MMTLSDEDATLYRAGYLAGHADGADGSRVPRAVYYEREKWWRIGWAIGNDDRVSGRDAWEAGERARSLGLPVTVNPWCPGTPDHDDFGVGHRDAKVGAIRWAVSEAFTEAPAPRRERCSVTP